jgi:hypothetical protein
LGVNVPDPSTMLSVTFTAANDAPLSPPTYSISFSSSPAPEVGFLDSTTTTPGTAVGTITVVPEPVTCALGLFASVFLGVSSIRWWVHKPQNYGIRTR